MNLTGFGSFNNLLDNYWNAFYIWVKYKKVLLRLLSIYSGILPITFFVLFFNRNKKDGLWVIFFYVFISFITDFTLSTFSVPDAIYIYFYSFFTFFEYALFSAFLFINIKSRAIRKFILVVSLLFLTFCTFCLLFLTDATFDNLPASVEAILIIIYCIIFFYEQINTPDISFIYASKKFWVATAFLLYLSGTLFLFIYTSGLTDNDKSGYWPINYFFNILKHLIIALSFYIPTSKPQSFLNDDLWGKPPLTHYKH